jgi:hypothetical protein
VLLHPSRHWTRLDLIVLLAGFAVLYVSVRSSLLIGDAVAFTNFARAGDPAGLHYGEPSHFLQVLLTRAIWQGGLRLGLPVTVGGTLVAISLAGSIAATATFGAIAGILLQSRAAAWLGAVLFGTSLQVWTQANGELYGLASAFTSLAIYAALRRRTAIAAVLFALGVLSHADFVLALPALLVALRLAEQDAPPPAWWRGAALLCALSGVLTLLVLLIGSRAIGKWHDRPQLVAWAQRSYTTRQTDIDPPQPARALKGLITADTAAGHVVRDIATGRAPALEGWFLAWGAIAAILIAVTAALVLAAFLEWRVGLFALAWMLPPHVLINWRFIPTVEKYHAAALPGFLLLVLTGLVAAGRRAGRAGLPLQVTFVVAGALVNLFGVLLPLRALGTELTAATSALDQLIADSGGRAVFVTCDAPAAVVRAGGEYLRIRAIWNAPPPLVEAQIVAWTTMQLANGRRVFVVGDRCLPEEWITTWSQAPFTLAFLEQRFTTGRPLIRHLPIAQTSLTDPLGWRYGDVRELRAIGR